MITIAGSVRMRRIYCMPLICPLFYGDGMRFALTFRLDIWKRLSLSAKLAYTHYWDRDLIGTDTEEISGSDKTDLYALLRWKF